VPEILIAKNASCPVSTVLFAARLSSLADIQQTVSSYCGFK